MRIFRDAKLLVCSLLQDITNTLGGRGNSTEFGNLKHFLDRFGAGNRVYRVVGTRAENCLYHVVLKA